MCWRWISFIVIAPDSIATHGTVLASKGEARTISAIEYELLSRQPYFYTQEELQFAVYLEREGIQSPLLDPKIAVDSADYKSSVTPKILR